LCKAAASGTAADTVALAAGDWSGWPAATEALA